MGLTISAIEKQAQRFLDSIAKGNYKLNGVARDVTIYKKQRAGDTVRIYLAIPPTSAGTISEIKLIDTDGDVVCVSADVIESPGSKGIYKSFKYKFVEAQG